MKRKKKFLHFRGFTLVEIVAIVIIISILAVLAFVAYTRVIKKSEDSEALINLAAIRKAELSKRDQTGTFVNATDTKEVNQELGTAEIQEKIFRYKVVNATREDFTAIAERIIKSDAPEEPVVIAMYANGGLSSTVSPVIGSSMGGGGSFSGSGGGGGGGGSGTGLGGGATSGGSGSSGGSGGGSSGGTGSGSGSGSGSGGDNYSTGGGASLATSGNYNGLSPYSDAKLDGALALLQGTTYGRYFYDLVAEKDISVSYTDLSSGGFLGLYIPPYWLDFYPGDRLIENYIYVSDSFVSDSSWSEEAIAAILVHEALHADYCYNTEKWVALTTERYGIDRSALSWVSNPVTSEQILNDSIDQEYNAFVQEALFWREVRGSQTNKELDGVLSLYEQDEALGTSFLYDAIARTYGELGYPPYLKELR